MLPLSVTGGGRICCPSEGAFDGQPQGLSLRHDIEFDLIATDSSYIFANSLGGSKPTPYRVVVSAENYQISIWLYQKA